MAEAKAIDLDKYKQMEERERSLAQKEQELKTREAEAEKRFKALEAAEAEAEKTLLRPAEKATLGPNPYRFSVGPRNEKYKDVLPTKIIDAIDETEAMRVYILQTAHPEKAGKTVDPLTYELKAVNLEPEKRAALIKKSKYLEMVRTKFHNGQVLTPEDEALLREADYS